MLFICIRGVNVKREKFRQRTQKERDTNRHEKRKNENEEKTQLPTIDNKHFVARGLLSTWATVLDCVLFLYR